MKKTKYLWIAGALLGAGWSSSAMAQYTVKLGYTHVQPRSSASEISGPFTPTGLSLVVKDASTVTFSVARDITDHFNLELVLGIPPTNDVAITVNNPALPASAQALNGAIGAKVRQVAPTVFANYKFMDKSSALRPFVGVGLNYTVFDKRDSTLANDTLNGGATSIGLKSSWGLALQGGVQYQIDKKWSVSAAVATAQVKTTLTTNTMGIERTADIKFSPVVTTLAVGYSF